MIAIVLQSGSNGNCVYVETDGAKLLFDAGISGLRAEGRLAAFGRDIRQVDGLIISHDHADHVACAGIYQRKFGLPIYITRKTLSAAAKWQDLGWLGDVRHFTAGEALRFGHVTVRTIPTPHDGVDGAAFVVADRGKALGILTDLGHVFDGLAETVESLDGVLLESNYDADMLLHGPYPQFLKDRIRGPGGHISNVESAGLLRPCAAGRLKWACLAHLSEQNNNPRLALKTHRGILGGHGAGPAGLALDVASRYAPTGPFEV